MTQMAPGGGLAAEGGCRSTLHAHPCLFQRSPKGNFRVFFSEEQTGINRQRFELIAAVTVTAQSWQRARLPSLAARSSEERPD